MADKREVQVPNIGDFEGVEIIEVLVSEGSEIHEEDSLITLESDKAAMDVPSPVSGTVSELKVKVGDRVSEGDVILIAEVKGQSEGAATTTKPAAAEDDETEQAGRPIPQATEPEHKAEHTSGGSQGDSFATKAEVVPSSSSDQRIAPSVDQKEFIKAHAGPAVRKFARELGVDLARVRGNGRKGRITFEDVKSHVKQAMRSGGGALPAVPEVDYERFGPTRRIELSRIKRIGGPRLQAAWINAPHVTQHDEADATVIETVRRSMKKTASEKGIKVTLLSFIVKAVVTTLKEYPAFNASLGSDGQTLIVKDYFNIGVAVDTDQGLVVPVIRQADQLGLMEIAGKLAEVSERARSGKLRRDDIEGGTFSISSLGGIGGTAFTPIINAPEVAILGISRLKVSPMWNGHAFEPRQMLPLSLSYDHRVIDGADAARFTRHLATTLETLEGMVV